MDINYYVEIVEFDTMEVTKRFGPNNERMAEKLDRGVNINLNHERFFTRIVSEGGADEGVGNG